MVMRMVVPVTMAYATTVSDDQLPGRTLVVASVTPALSDDSMLRTTLSRVVDGPVAAGPKLLPLISTRSTLVPAGTVMLENASWNAA